LAERNQKIRQKCWSTKQQKEKLLLLSSQNSHFILQSRS
jgi:hypothetical protein